MSKLTGYAWKPLIVDGFSGDYIISERREVFNYVLRKNVTCNYSDGRYTGKYVRLRFDKKCKAYRMDRLMLLHFSELAETDDEEWRTICIGTDSTNYEVSPSGRFRRADDHRQLKLQTRADGYQLVRIRHDGKIITLYAHRAVATAYIPNPEGFDLVNHKDENRSNNAVTNLEWCDKKYNMLYAGSSKRARDHSMLTKKLKKLEMAGNSEAAEILKNRKYYEDSALLQKALEIIA